MVVKTGNFLHGLRLLLPEETKNIEECLWHGQHGQQADANQEEREQRSISGPRIHVAHRGSRSKDEEAGDPKAGEDEKQEVFDTGLQLEPHLD